MIVFLIQQDKLFMEYYMIHQLQYKTMKKAKINDPKYCDKSTNNRNMSASDLSIKTPQHEQTGYRKCKIF